MDDADILYFTRRESEERQRAEGSPDSAISRLHLRMADHYRQALDAVARSGLLSDQPGNS